MASGSMPRPYPARGNILTPPAGAAISWCRIADSPTWRAHFSAADKTRPASQCHHRAWVTLGLTADAKVHSGWCEELTAIPVVLMSGRRYEFRGCSVRDVRCGRNGSTRISGGCSMPIGSRGGSCSCDSRPQAATGGGDQCRPRGEPCPELAAVVASSFGAPTPTRPEKPSKRLQDRGPFGRLRPPQCCQYDDNPRQNR